MRNAVYLNSVAKISVGITLPIESKKTIIWSSKRCVKHPLNSQKDTFLLPSEDVLSLLKFAR